MNRVGKFLHKRFCVLTAAILAGLSAATSVAAAEEVTVEHVRHNGRDFAELAFFPKGYGLGKDGAWYVKPAVYTLPGDLIDAMQTGTSYWADVLGDGVKNTAPWQILVTTDNEQNANAFPRSLRSDGSKAVTCNEQFFVVDQLQEGRALSMLEQETLAAADRRVDAAYLLFKDDFNHMQNKISTGLTYCLANSKGDTNVIALVNSLSSKQSLEPEPLYYGAGQLCA